MSEPKAELLDIMAAQSVRLEPLATELPSRLQKLKGIRALVFDVYGTLFISGSGDISLAEEMDRDSVLMSLLEEAGHNWHSDSVRVGDAFIDLIRATHERDRKAGIDFPEVEIREIWQDLIRLTGYQGEVEPEIVEPLAVRYETLVNPVWPMPGLSAMFERLKPSGYSLGIISNAQFYTPLLFEHFLGDQIAGVGFDETLCVWSYRERIGKPSGILFEKCVERLAAQEIRPEEVLYIGNDMRNDIVPAAKAGMRTALFAGDARSLRLRDHSRDNIPSDVVVTELMQLFECLD